MKTDEVELLARISTKKDSNNWLKNIALTSNSEKPYKCEYCGNGYMREKTLAAHMCEPKRRWLQKDEKRVRYGLYAFQRFYALSAGTKKRKLMKILRSLLIITLLLNSAVLLAMLSHFILSVT